MLSIDISDTSISCISLHYFTESHSSRFSELIYGTENITLLVYAVLACFTKVECNYPTTLHET